jgi:hypothetical protein
MYKLKKVDFIEESRIMVTEGYEGERRGEGIETIQIDRRN